MKRNLKIQPRHILVNTIFALSFSSSAIEIMAHYSPRTSLKKLAYLIIIYSFQFFSSISWQVSEHFMWIIRKDFTITNGWQRLFQFPKVVNTKHKTTTKSKQVNNNNNSSPSRVCTETEFTHFLSVWKNNVSLLKTFKRIQPSLIYRYFFCCISLASSH